MLVSDRVYEDSAVRWYAIKVTTNKLIWNPVGDAANHRYEISYNTEVEILCVMSQVTLAETTK